MKRNLCTICLKNPSEEVRGKLRRYLYELRPNVFSGTISLRVRELLWEKIKEAGTDAFIVHSDQTEQGFTYKSTYQDLSGFEDLDGILLPFHHKTGIDVSDLYAKPSKKLIDHLMDAGEVSEALMRYGIGAPAIEVMSERFSIPKEDLIQSISWLCAVHDIGKAHPGFQKSLAESGSSDAADACMKLTLGGYILPEDEKIRHERYSAEIIRNYFLEEGYPSAGAKVYSDILLYHHQGKTEDRKICEGVFCYHPDGDRWKDWRVVHKEILGRVSDHWTFSDKMFSIVGHAGINGFTYLILSIMVTTDWVVSGAIWAATLQANNYDIKSSARRFVEDHYLTHISIKDRFLDISWKGIFSFERNKLQEELYQADIEDSQLMLIECPCGYGKTEAALTAAIKLCKNKGGIYFAAPTTSTAKGLTKRLQKLAEKAGLDIPIPELDSSMIWSDDDMSRIPKELWTSKTRHQGLYPFAVGTVDQILKSVLEFRYSCIGLLGLSDKVVIIDEVHAYDAYMLKELECLVHWCRFLHVPIILLSATLPTKTKKILFKAAGCGNANISKAHPLVSLISNKMLIEKPIDMPGRIIPVSVVRTKDTEEYMIQEAVNFQKGCLALIQSTVDNAFCLYRRLQEEITDGIVLLYHGRDTVDHKTKKVKELLRLCGKDRSFRPEKLIVVATSIIEQSLDVDFDKMITVLAPDDLLIQRMGRVWRHPDAGTIREHMIILDPFVIVCPEKYDSLGRIYEKNILSATEEVLQGLTQINTVSDIRDLIDTVYDNAVIESEISKRIDASRHTIDGPAKDVAIITKGTDDAYQHFNPVIPRTRDESYPAQTICILPELKEEYSYEEMRQIMQNNVVPSVSTYKIEPFEKQKVETNIRWFDDIAVYISRDLCIDNGENVMRLTEDGLEFI